MPELPRGYKAPSPKAVIVEEVTLPPNGSPARIEIYARPNGRYAADLVFPSGNRWLISTLKNHTADATLRSARGFLRQVYGDKWTG